MAQPEKISQTVVGENGTKVAVYTVDSKGGRLVVTVSKAAAGIAEALASKHVLETGNTVVGQIKEIGEVELTERP